MKTTRRRVMAGALAATVALALAGCVQSANQAPSGSSSGSKHTLTVFVSADTNIQDLWQKTLIPAFEKANPSYSVKVDFDLHGVHDQQTVAKITAATVQKRDPGYDIVDAGFVQQLSTSGLLATATPKQIPNLSKVAEAIRKPGGANSVPYRASSVLLAYNSDKISSPPKTVDDLLAWIKANPGKFTYCSPASGGSGGAFVTTVLDKSIPSADRAKMVTSYEPNLETDWNAGWATLRSLNPYVYQQGVYPNGNNQVLDLLSSGQILMAPVWSDQFTSGVQSGQIPKNIKATQTTPSLTGGASYLGVLKASPRAKDAYKLLNWLLTPSAQASISESVAGYPVIPLKELPQSIQTEFANAQIDKLRPTYQAQMNNDMNQQWSQQVPGK